MTFRFAIIDSNTLMCLGLQQMLSSMLPMAESVVFSSLEELEREEASYAMGEGYQPFIHYFVSSRIYFEHTAFFRQHPKKTIVLVNGDMMINGVHTLNVCQTEAALTHDFLALQSMGKGPRMVSTQSEEHTLLLSPREIEIAILLCKGLINKEIADQLNISMTTVISHRKNIMEKLHAKSIADVIIYIVMNGLVNIGDL